MFALGQAEMAKKLDVARIEKARRKEQTEDRRELEKRRIQDTIDQNRRGERKGRVIMPQHKEYAYDHGRSHGVSCAQELTLTPT